MGRNPRSHRKKRVTGGASAEISAANDYMAPSSGLNNVLFTRSTTRDISKFTDTLNKLARHVGIQAWSQLTVVAKAMIKLVAPAWTEPSKPVRMYYLAVNQGDAVPIPKLQTTERFEVGTMTKNIEVADDIDWKMTLSEYAVKLHK